LRGAGAGQSNPPGTNISVSFNINSYETLTSEDESWRKIQPGGMGTEALNNLVSLRINNNLFTFVNLESSGIVPGAIPTFVYAPQDTLLALEHLSVNNSLNVHDGKATNTTYQWYYNVEPLAGETNDTLIGIEPLGGYYCKVNNTTYPDLELSSEQYGIIEYDLSTDSLALVTLYQATQGESWNNHGNWLTGPITTWYGVTIESNRVTRLELQNNNLSGIMPFEICYLTGLKALNLGGNWFLNGTIPSQIDNLALMEDLLIFNTQISGILPSSLGNLVNLTLLNLGWNNFSPGTLPDLSGAENLQVLLLGNCQLTGTIPAWLLSMPNLRQLALDNNNFDPGSMPDFSGLTQLNDLNVYNCKFTGEIPASLLGMSQMTYLTIGSNNFTPNPIPDFSSMTGLQLLNASSCHFTGAIRESLGLLTQLWSLQLNFNELTGNIPEDINGLVNLNYLNLSNNQLTGSLPVDFGNFPNLRELILNNNQLSGPVPGALGNCNNLKRLRLANNLFHHVHLEPIFSWGNFAGITDFTYAPQGTIGTEKTWYISEGKRFELEIASYTPSTNDVFQWNKNNVLLPDANGPELVFEAVATANSGAYHCVVSNTVTTQLNLTSRTVYLNVGSLGLVGTHNTWGGSGADEPFVQDTENPDLWSLQYTFANSGEAKIRWNNDWSMNWGNNQFPVGTALSFGPNIPIPAGRYQIDFNIATGEYSFQNTDSLALVALYNSTGGENWNNKTNWLTGPLSTWFGVVTENGRVVGLNLGWDNNINGELPDQIGDLSAIRWFIASGNNGLTGNIPATIGNWTNLETLGLYNCSLTGVIPAELLTLSQLKLIELSYNNFDAAPMPNFGLLPNLQTLTIEDCNFTGPIPEGLSGLTQLTRLYLSGNPNLDAGGIPNLSASTNLSVLAMNNCNRTGTLPAWITQMANLQRIILGNNHLSGAIPVNFIDPNNIIEFILGWNNFDEAPMPDLSLLVNLEVVNLANSKLTGGVPGWFTSLSKLNDINLSFNQLEGSIPASLDNLTNLWHLNLEHNHFSGTLPAALANLGALRFAYLNDNAFSGNFPDLSGLAALETLNIRYNRHTFANLATSGLEPSDIDTWLYDPQDTLLAIQKEGTSLTALDCQHPNNQITWFREGTQLAATTRSIEADIDGRYWFTVENSVYTDLTLYSDTIEVSTQEVPEDYQVSAYSISDGNSDCLNAQNNLTVAGDGSTVILLGGSSVNFIAGHSVRFLPGFHAQQGSVAAAWITSDGTFCDSHGARSIVKVESPEKSQYIGISKNTTTNGPTKQVKVYPNPCSGTLNLELLGYIGESQVTVSNMQGSVVYRSVAVKSGQTRHDLSHLSQGMYLLRVQNGQEQFTRKVVIR